MEYARWELENWQARSHGIRDKSLFTGSREVASYLWQSSKRGAVLVLVVAFSPYLVPLVLLVILVGLISVVPLLCGAAAYHLLFRDAALPVRGTLNLLLSAKWDSRYEQRNDERNWSTGDVFIAAALRSDVADVSRNESSVETEGEQTKSSTRMLTTDEECERFSPDCKQRSVSASDYTWPSDSSEQDFETLSTRGTEYEDTASSTAHYEEESDLEPVTSSATPEEVTEDWLTRRKRWEEESTLGRLAPSSSVEARSICNPLFEFESTPSLPLIGKLNSGDKNHLCNSPSFRTRASKRGSTPRELRRTQTWSTSGSTLSPRLKVHESKSGLENRPAKASCEACVQSRDGELIGRAGSNARSSLRLPWR